MLKKLISFLNNKTITIWGYGVEGKSTHDFLSKYTKSEVFIVDSDTNIKDRNGLFSKSDLIFKSPGISLHNNNLSFTDYNFTSSSEVFLRFFGSLCIGITGTKGKSTTAKLIYELIQNTKEKVDLAGNIGIPFFDIIPNISEKDFVVAEFSSHQLENIKYSPHIAILLNLFEEHLDYYASAKDYFQAKYNIYKHQNTNDKLITLPSIKNTPYPIEDIKYTTDVLIHQHSISVLFQVAKILNINTKLVDKTIAEFTSLEHRLEFVIQKNGTKYYNDSISTIPQSCIEGIKALKDVNILILGGMDRGIDYSSLCQYIENDNNIKYLFLLDKTGQTIFNNIDKSKFDKVVYKETLSEIISELKNLKLSGVCLFSPAASSYNQFKNFQERGNYFKSLINEL
ncbi:MAG: UDP-N-acetylmuramoylalanine--D-glutamate ligase (EC [uncultured Campylobacterales bacterium]|uniref:UDP-N-acetylmuramoylalanine--D-glutamate ligase n=1 Tax=uncultured Campylobacterales bacterium TaxID=352960 RepID=A0A6S6SD00_9BACT|nr:MAG: UDP-N-acetylmuramoylalanine--D-glutamate ligase (EC [uncultured Campylobacterales bacterium]